MTDARTELRIATVKGLDGRIHGTGVLVAPQHVLTCAHVVASALDAPASGGRPRGEVLVRLPASPTDRHAEVEPGGWLPLREGGRGDLAVLQLMGVFEDTPRSVLRHRAGVGTRVHVLPGRQAATRRRLTAVVREVPEPGSTGWSRLDFDGDAPGPGLSGAPVWDSENGRIVGIVTAGPLRGADASECWMLPVSETVGLFPSATARPSGRSGSLTAREMGELRETLLSVLLEPHELALLIGAMDPSLTSSVPRHPVSRQQSLALLHTCARRPDGLRSLATALSLLKPGSPEVERFAVLVDRLTAEPLLLPPERRRLHELLASASPLTELSWLSGSAVATAATAATATDDLVARAADLEDAFVPDGGTPALLGFVSRIAAVAEPSTREALRLWLGEVAERLGLQPPPLPVRAEGGAPWVLKFLLEAAAWDRARFELSAWLVRDPGENPLRLPGSSQALSPETVAEVVSGTLRQVERQHLPHTARLRVEFELPPHLLGLPVEHWPMDTDTADPGGSALGVLYPVTVRAPRRTAELPPRLARWRELARSGALSSRWSEGDDLRVLCLGGPAPAPTRSGRSGAALWETVLRAGVPVALWSREGVAECEERIEELVTHADLTSLPEAVHRLRRDQRGCESIALLYDDPRSDLSPSPPFRLSPP